MVYYNKIGTGHFDTLRIPLLAGRDFTRRDAEKTTPVVIINETLARAMWPGDHAAAAVGKRLQRYQRNVPPGGGAAADDGSGRRGEEQQIRDGG